MDLLIRPDVLYGSGASSSPGPSPKSPARPGNRAGTRQAAQKDMEDNEALANQLRGDIRLQQVVRDSEDEDKEEFEGFGSDENEEEFEGFDLD